VVEDFGVQIVRQLTFRQFYDVWMTKGFHNPMRKKLYIAAFFAVSWSLWAKRNKMIFEQLAEARYACSMSPDKMENCFLV